MTNIQELLSKQLFAADKPIRHVEDDKYGREKYVDNLAYALLTGDDSDGLVVGIEYYRIGLFVKPAS